MTVPGHPSATTKIAGSPQFNRRSPDGVRNSVPGCDFMHPNRREDEGRVRQRFQRGYQHFGVLLAVRRAVQLGIVAWGQLHGTNDVGWSRIGLLFPIRLVFDENARAQPVASVCCGLPGSPFYCFGTGNL